MSFFASQTIRRRRAGGGSTLVDSQVANYASRLAAHGRTMTSRGEAFIREIFQAAYDYGKTVSNGWAMGSEFNVSRNRLINLVAGKSSLVPKGTLNGSTVLHDAMLGVRVEGTGLEGYITDDNGPLFTGERDYSVLMGINYAGDPPNGTSPNLFKQYVIPSINNIDCYGGVQGGLQFIARGWGSTGFAGATNGGSQFMREGLVDPLLGWVHINGNNQFEMIDANYGSSGLNPWVDNPSDKPLELCNSPSSLYSGDVGWAFLIRFDGEMDEATHHAIYRRIMKKWCNIGRSVCVAGNSVTIPSSTTHESWCRLMQRYLVYHSGFIARRAQGAMRLPKFAPLGYALPGPPPDAFNDVSTMSVDTIKYYFFNTFINDDQQNMVGSGQPWSNWIHCHNSFTQFFKTLLDDPSRMRGVMGTQMAHQPYTFGLPPEGHVFVPWGTGHVSNSNWYQISQRTRAATLEDFDNVPTTIADIWEAITMGYPPEIDGTPIDKINDYTNGNPAFFVPNDSQHTNVDGQLVMANRYIDAYERAIAL